MYDYYGSITRWKDADTAVVAVDVGFHLGLELTVRVRDLWAAEMDTPEGRAAKAAAEGLATPGTRVIVRTHKTRTGTDIESMGRYVADIQLPDGRDFASAMVTGGWGTAAKTG